MEAQNVTECLREALKIDKLKLVKEFVATPEDFNYKFEPTTAPLPSEIAYYCPILSASIYFNATKSFEYLAEGGSKLTGTDGWLCGPLHMAARMGRLNILQSQYFQSANFSVPEWRGRTPAHFACENGHLDCLRFLIEEKGCDINAADKFNMTLLHVAFEFGQINIIEYLLNNGAQITTDVQGRTPLDIAAQKGQLDALRYVSAHRISSLTQTGVSGKSPLHWAAIAGNSDEIDFLGSISGIDVNQIDKVGLAPLHYAAEHNHSDAIRSITAIHGCNHVITDARGETPMHYAAFFNSAEAVAVLASANPDMNDLSDKSGKTPLILAISNGHVAVTQALMRCGVDGHKVDSNGMSPSELSKGTYSKEINQILAGKQVNLESVCDPRKAPQVPKPNPAQPKPEMQQDQGFCQVQ